MGKKKTILTKQTGFRRYSGLSIQEITDEEYAYDADVEVLTPDSYDEVTDTCDESESSASSEENWRTELVAHMKTLSCDPEHRTQPSKGSNRGLKRRSRDASTRSTLEATAALSSHQMEITEVSDDEQSIPRAKRTRRSSPVLSSEEAPNRHINETVREAPVATSNGQSGECSKVGSSETDSSISEHRGDAMEVD